MQIKPGSYLLALFFYAVACSVEQIYSLLVFGSVR